METVVSNRITRYPEIRDKFGARPVLPSQVLAEKTIHTYGRVALISTYHSDDMIVDAAQVSVGRSLDTQLDGSEKTPARTPSDTRRLIRYLIRHRHTSPLEQAEATFYLRLPIFVARQLVRHRTANLNEYSARYSELSDDYYVPGPEYLARQSTSNKQGRGGEPFTDAEKAEITNIMVESQETSVNAYRKLLDMGVSRELARIPTSVGIYTEMYWKCDLHNLMHFFKLRTDAHAQQEIRDVANAMFACVEPYFPLAFDAWEDFNRDAYTLSRAEIRLLGNLLNRHDGETMVWGECPRDMSEREYSDFKFFINTLRMRESG